MCLAPMFILFLPILIPVLMGQDTVYSWVQPGWSATSAAEADAIAKLPAESRPPLEVLKLSFLNKGFFSVRVVAYFADLERDGRVLPEDFAQAGSDRRQKTDHADAGGGGTGDDRVCGSLVFSSFDLEMTLSPLWFSTMFPVYFFAGAVFSSLCVITITAAWLQHTGRVTDEITVEHYHDLGKLMLGFVVFWGYIAFSQFMLIWYANIPEETFWYDLRINQPGWMGLSLILLVGHLFIPFLAIMGRTANRNKMFLCGTAIWLLLMHWVDHYWLVMPQFDPAGTHDDIQSAGGYRLHVGMISLFVALFCLVAQGSTVDRIEGSPTGRSPEPRSSLAS